MNLLRLTAPVPLACDHDEAAARVIADVLTDLSGSRAVHKHVQSTAGQRPLHMQRVATNRVEYRGGLAVQSTLLIKDVIKIPACEAISTHQAVWSTGCRHSGITGPRRRVSRGCRPPIDTHGPLAISASPTIKTGKRDRHLGAAAPLATPLAADTPPAAASSPVEWTSAHHAQHASIIPLTCALSRYARNEGPYARCGLGGATHPRDLSAAPLRGRQAACDAPLPGTP